jgi:hypothetical protein
VGKSKNVSLGNILPGSFTKARFLAPSSGSIPVTTQFLSDTYFKKSPVPQPTSKIIFEVLKASMSFSFCFNVMDLTF